MKYQTYLYGFLVAMASLLASCSSDITGDSPTDTPNDSIHQLNRLYVQVMDEDERGVTRISSVDNHWRVGDCVYIRNVDGVYAKDQEWRRYIYRANGYFTPYSSHPDSVINFIGSNHYVEAFFRGDDQKGGGIGSNGRAEPTAEGTECLGFDTPFTVLADQTTEEKVQQCDYLYTKQKVVYMENQTENIGAVYLQLKHKVSQVFVNVKIGSEHTLKYVHINNGSTKLYQVAKPTRSGTEELDLIGTTKYPSNTDTEVKYIDPQPNPGNAEAYAKDGFYQFKCFIVPQHVAESNLQQHFVDVCVTKDATDYHYYYDLPMNHTFVKGRTYTYSLTLTENNFKNVFDIHQAQDALTNRDLGKILCVGGWLVPTVTEAKLKGFKPMGMLVQFSGNVNDGYTGLCMSLEDIAQNTTLANALTAVYNYKNRDTDVSHNPGDLNWCSDWFIPTENQWKSVMGYSLNGQSGDADYVNNTQGIGGVYYANKNHTDMIADLQNDQGDAYEHEEMSCVALASNTNYWTSTITGANAATTLKNASSSQEVTNNTSSTTANTRAFFIFDSRTTPDPYSIYRTAQDAQTCKFIMDIDNDNDGTDLYRYVTSSDYGRVIAKQTNGWWCIMPNTTYVSNFASGTVSAMIAYIGSGTGESSPYNHGLAISAADNFTGYYWSSGNWQENNTTYGNTADYFPQISSGNVSSQWMSEAKGGYEKTKWVAEGKAQNASIDNYPAFKQCWNHSRVRPIGASNWFLPSARQFGIIFDYASSKSGYTYSMSNYYTTINNNVGNWTYSFNSNTNNTANYLNTIFSNAGVSTIMNINYFMTSTMYNASNYWIFYPHTSNGYLWTTSGKQTSYYIRPFYAF